jgi:hypothetical protein
MQLFKNDPSDDHMGGAPRRVSSDRALARRAMIASVILGLIAFAVGAWWVLR